MNACRKPIAFAFARACLAGNRALVLDDSSESFGRISVSLLSAGCGARFARRWAQAREIIRDFNPTLVIFSMRMKDIEIPLLIQEVRETEATRGAHLIALADHESRREERAMRGLGCDGYLWKPTDRLLFAMDLVRRTPSLRAPSLRLDAAS